MGLWVAVTRAPIAEIEVSVPIEFHRIPDNLEISSESIPQAQIRVRGPERLVRGLRPPDIHVEIDLAGTKAGERTFDLTAQQVREPRDLEVVQIVPAVDSAITDPVDATGTVERASFITHAYVSDPLVQVVHPVPVRVTVTMEKIRSSSSGF